MIIGIGIQTYYSIQHVQAAAYMTRQAAKVEAELTGDTAPEAVVLKAYVCSALFSSVAFLEALANEIYADAIRPDGGHLSALAELDRLMMAALGETPESVQKASILSKYAILLRAAGKSPLPTDCDPHQAILTVIRLRNEIVHYKASFFDVGTEGMVRAGSFHTSKLPSQIKGKFELRRNAQGLSGDSWIGHGLAQWAVKSALAYADANFTALGIKPYYDHVRSNLGTTDDASNL
ncbi:MAG: hypothetical protein ACK4GU_16370 [Alishewanella aestuarii]